MVTYRPSGLGATLSSYFVIQYCICTGHDNKTFTLYQYDSHIITNCNSGIFSTKTIEKGISLSNAKYILKVTVERETFMCLAVNFIDSDMNNANKTNYSEWKIFRFWLLVLLTLIYYTEMSLYSTTLNGL